MVTSQGPSPSDEHPENTYVVDAESAAEMARLMRQDRLLTAGMGGIFPEPIDLSTVQRVLDLACGPGGWALDVAYTYTDMEVVGVDISERMIAYANAQAQVQQRTNLNFRTMNILQPLDFPEASFDLINARLIAGFMRREFWPALFRECLRVLRPGGIFRLTELEIGMSNKLHFEETFHMLFQAMGRAGLNFSPNGTHLGIVHMLPRLFHDANLTILGQMAHSIDFSFGTGAHEGFYHDWAAGFQLVEPLIVKMGVATTEKWRETYKTGLAEMHQTDFCASTMLLTLWGSQIV